MSGYPTGNSTIFTPISEIIDVCKVSGSTFVASASLDLTAADDDSDDIENLGGGDGGYSFTGFRTGDKPVILYRRKISYNDDGVIAYIYREPTFVGGTIGGSPSTNFRNPNDINAKPSTVVINGGLASAGNAGDVLPLGSETATREFVFGNQSNQGAGGFVSILDEPVIISPNKQYLLIFKSEAGVPQSVASHLGWAGSLALCLMLRGTL